MTAMLKSLFSRIPLKLGSMPALPTGMLKSLAPIVILSIGITAVVLLFVWRDQSSYKPVFGAREKVAASDMMAVLDTERIPYHVHPESGQVMVPESMLGKVRMLLASKGVVAKLPAGLDLMDRNDPLGVSQFVQDVRFRRGLEGDLAQSIMALEAVDSARVHLSIAKSSSFVISDGEKSSASVMLALKSGRKLNPEHIAAVVNLVAGSVASLDPQRISVIDQAGNLLSSRIDLATGYEAGQGNDAARRFQDEARNNAQELLTQMVGRQNYEISVTAEVDNDHVQETREKYGEAPKITTEAVREEMNPERMAIGVPGSLSNRPVNPVPTVPDANAKSKSADVSQKSATSRQYAYDRNIIQIKRSRGRLHRLNVAVVLNSAAAPGDGVWNPEELANIERVLRSGLGIDAERGDKLTVSAFAFPAAPQPESWWQQRDNIIEMVTWLAYAIAVVLAYLLLARPLLRITQQRMAPVPLAQPPLNTVAMPQAPQLTTGNRYAAAIGTLAEPSPMVPLLENYHLPPAGSPVDVMVEHLKVLVAKEPERVAEVVKQWVQKNV